METALLQNETGIKPRVLNEIRRFAVRNDIRKVVLFGSRARGDHSERSDIDIAIYGGRFDGFYWNIMEDAHTLLSFDVVDMDSGVSGELQKEIERDGITIYEKA